DVRGQRLRADAVRAPGAGGDRARHRDLPCGDRALHGLGLRGEPGDGAHRTARSRARVHGGSALMLSLDLSFFTWALFTDYILKGLVFSIQLTLVAMLGGIVFGTLLALMRLSGSRWLELPAATYVNGMRSIPLVIVILWFYLVIHFILGRPIGAGLSAFITFTAFEAAYYSEIMRAGIQSVSRGQAYAGQAIGLSYAQNMRYVVLPQAFRNMLPVLLTQTIILFQDTSLV